MQVDYIIVGFGLAGMSFAKVLEEQGKSFVVIDDDSQVSSKVAAGVFNPAVLKRFTPVWNVVEQMANMKPFYESLEQQFAANYLVYFDTFKVFKSIEDQNNWFAACDHPVLADYLEPTINYQPIDGILCGEGLGLVKGTGRVLINNLLADYQSYLTKKSAFLKESFNYEELLINQDSVQYHHITAGKIVFAEGFGVTKNPFFSYLPLDGTKGELLMIKAPGLKLTAQIKSTLFILPEGDDVFWVGATFHWQDKTFVPTTEARKELEEKLATMITVPYEIVNQYAGIRPTVKDRRPMVGAHPKHQNVFVLNGLGTRGVMIAPTLSKQLYHYIEHHQSLPKEIAIDRFTKFYR